jgi:very-short-patch-repair endonuclease
MQTGTTKKKQRYWPTTAEHAAHMRMRQEQNREQCKLSRAEEWMRGKLKITGLKWTRQAQSGVRLFDFWNHALGIAVEVDGPEHDSARDAARDYAVYASRGIVVLRVRNFDEHDAALAVAAISGAMTWNQRRATLALAPIRT